MEIRSTRKDPVWNARFKGCFCANYQPALELPNAVEQNHIVSGRITVDAREKDQLFLMMMAFLPFGKPVFTIYECFATKDHLKKEKARMSKAFRKEPKTDIHAFKGSVNQIN